MIIQTNNIDFRGQRVIGGQKIFQISFKIFDFLNFFTISYIVLSFCYFRFCMIKKSKSKN